MQSQKEAQRPVLRRALRVELPPTTALPTTARSSAWRLAQLSAPSDLLQANCTGWAAALASVHEITKKTAIPNPRTSPTIVRNASRAS